MIKIALCDDESSILNQVCAHLNQYTQLRPDQNFEITCFDSAKALEFVLEESTFDIFVLDVYIGEEIGTELARKIRKKGIESPIIFLTTSIEHAPESFETGTLRYLIKPLDPQKFIEAMDAAIAQAEKANQRLIKLKTENGVESINAQLVLYSEAHDHYQHVTLSDTRRIKVRMTVTELYGLLMKSGGFVRVGSAYIVNLRNIKNVSTSDVRLYNNISIPIPRGKHTEIKKAFWDYQYDGQEE